MSDPERASIASRYRRFASLEAKGRSSLYEALATGVSEDDELLAFLELLPVAKRQPNLFFGVVRLLFGDIRDMVHFKATVRAHGQRIRTEMLTRATQTNEPARCAVFLPILSRLPQPLALVEVGASAGLCLFPDLYGYDYGGGLLLPAAAPVDPPVFPCAVDPPELKPARLPEIAWRAGLDLNPIDPADGDHATWLRSLVWPEQVDRLSRLDRALALTSRHRRAVRPGDLRTDLPALCADAPAHATLVVMHTAVLAYLDDPAERNAFAAAAQESGAIWLANESPRVFPDIADTASPPPNTGCFLLSMNGRPIAWTDPHGSAVTFLTADPFNEGDQPAPA